jgi:membrane-associated phospholipid phosphatase
MVVWGLLERVPSELYHAVSARIDVVDRHVIAVVAWHRLEWANQVAVGTMYAGTGARLLVGAIVAVLVAVVALRAYRAAVVAALCLVASMVAAEALKQVFERSRPPAHLALATASSYSFPSTQGAETSAIAAGLIVLLLAGPGWGPRLSTGLSMRVKIVLSVLLVAAVGFVGVCIVYLGAHWLTDVVAGWLLGTTIGATIGWVGGRVGGVGGVGDRVRSDAWGRPGPGGAAPAGR